MTSPDRDHGPCGRYELRGLLGQGRVSSLCRAEGPDGRAVVVRRLHPWLLDAEPGLVARWVEGARRLAQVRSDQVVTVLEVGAGPGGAFVVLDHVEGETAGRMAREASRAGERLPTAVVGRIVLDVLAGVEAVHEARDAGGAPLGLLVRELRERHVLVGHDGLARLTDRLDHAIEYEPGLQERVGFRGQLFPMPIEQLRGEPLDRRADVWGGGAIAWQLLAGQRLFGGDSDFQRVHRMLEEDAPDVRAFCPEVPDEVAAVIARALARDREARWPTAAALAGALEAAWAGWEPLASRAQVASWVLATSGWREREAASVGAGACPAEGPPDEPERWSYRQAPGGPEPGGRREVEPATGRRGGWRRWALLAAAVVAVVAAVAGR